MSELKYAVWLKQALGEGGALPAKVFVIFMKQGRRSGGFADCFI